MSQAAGGNEMTERRAGGFSIHSVRLARILTFAYLLTIVYASLQPFRGWRIPPEDIRYFFFAPWPHYITLEDLAVNVVAYMPLGFLLSIAYGTRYNAGLGVLAAAFYASGLSLTMEAIQVFLPSRIASNLDLLTNSLGALIGAMAAPLFSPSRLFGRGLHAWRRRVMREGMVADAGFVIVCLWMLTQLHPTAQLFGTGAVRGVLDLPVSFAHTPQMVLSGEAAVAFFNLCALGLIVAALMKRTARPMMPIAAVVGAGLALKTVAAVLAKSAHPFVWMTPGVSFGLLAGWLSLYGLIYVPRRIQLVLAALCILAGAAAINMAPENPYQSVPPQFIAGGASHYLSISAIVRALADLWPLLAIVYLSFALFERGKDAPPAR